MQIKKAWGRRDYICSNLMGYGVIYLQPKVHSKIYKFNY